MEVCSPEGLSCVRNISLTYEECPERCEGLIVGVRKEPVRRENSEGFGRLQMEYENYKCHNYSDVYFTSTIRAILKMNILLIMRYSNIRSEV